MNAHPPTMRPPRTLAFADRVMAQVAVEPRPTPARVLLRSLRALRLGDAWAATTTAWHLALGGSGATPLLARFQSLALVLMLAVALGTGGTLAAAGAFRLVELSQTPPPPPAPPAVLEAAPSPSPSLIASPTPSDLPMASPAKNSEPGLDPAAAVPARGSRAQQQDRGDSAQKTKTRKATPSDPKRSGSGDRDRGDEEAARAGGGARIADSERSTSTPRPTPSRAGPSSASADPGGRSRE